MSSPLSVSNRNARWSLIHACGLRESNCAGNAIEIVRRLGLVQIDSIQVISRAHHHILWSRCLGYRERDFDRMLERDRSVFEHFTHDASILPMEIYPYWRRQFANRAREFEKSAWGREMASAGEQREIVARIAEEGPLSTADFDGVADKSSHAWARPPHKQGLDYLWHCGELAIPFRRNFVKYYDLAERVIPSAYYEREIDDEVQVDFLCREALRRLVVGTPGEIQRFWEAMNGAEVRDWLERHRHELMECEVTGADGSRWRGWALQEMEPMLREPTPVTSRLRILSPFDPLVRDRKRLERLFGFDFRIEIFVPRERRKYGYYVYPILEGDRFVGRIEAVADRKSGTMSVKQVWMEGRYGMTSKRREKLELELRRLGRLAGVEFVGEVSYIA